MTASVRAQRLIWPAAYLTVVAIVGDFVLLALNAGSIGTTAAGPDSLALRIEIPIFGVAFVLVGALVASRQPRNPVGWIFWGGGIEAAIQSLMTEYSWTASRIGPLPGATETGWLAGGLGEALFLLAFTNIVLFFPDGHLPSPRWRPVAIAAGVLIAISGLLQTIYTAPGSPSSGPPVASTLALPAVLVAIVGLVVKYRRADRDRRQQIKWVAFAAAVILVCVLILPAATVALLPHEFFTSAVASSVFGLGTLTIVLLPIAMAIAILRYRLYDIDVVINRTLAYGALALAITLIYVAVVVGVGSLVGRGGQANFILSIAATALVAVVFQPIRARAQRFANRLVYGERATPYEVLSRFSERIADTVASDETLGQMARVLAQGTGATRAEVWLRGASTLHCAAAYPEPFERPEPVPLPPGGSPQIAGADAVAPVSHQGELLGALAVRKRKGESMSPIEEKLLADLARQAGLVLKNVGLTADLRRRLEELRASRERLVSAQDAERRRLERNIHDGAQQNLVALKVKLGLARHTWKKQPERMEALLDELVADADESLNTLRELARGIYPPLLAEKGLATALEAQGRRASIPVQLSTNGAGRYRPDLEAAIYFCCLEALQNAAKYSGASLVQIQLSQENGELVFAVKDDGRGYDALRMKPGAGLQNMIDRVEALGGRLEIESAVGTGTLVTGHVPVPVI
ncbi:MAG TPA: sensor histidine kinase [Candidatus Dormibacteraeota bacterium]|nr:sensor histidine kinase [Candidatus Dormibacteraeota bacterium]